MFKKYLLTFSLNKTKKIDSAFGIKNNIKTRNICTHLNCTYNKNYALLQCIHLDVIRIETKHKMHIIES